MGRNRKFMSKLMIVMGIMLFTSSLGFGLNKVLAGQDIGSLLTNWFNGKQEDSIQHIEQAITLEKELLMGELRIALLEEMKRTEQELADYTATETARRVAELQSYAADLMANLNIDTSAKKAEISADLDAALANALSQLNSVAPLTCSSPDSVISKPSPPVEDAEKDEENQVDDTAEEERNDSEDESKSGDSTEIELDEHIEEGESGENHNKETIQSLKMNKPLYESDEELQVSE